MKIIDEIQFRKETAYLLYWTNIDRVNGNPNRIQGLAKIGWETYLWCTAELTAYMISGTIKPYILECSKSLFDMYVEIKKLSNEELWGIELTMKGRHHQS